MATSQTQIARELERLGASRIAIVSELAGEGEPDGIGAALLLAIGSRESNMRNIVGDGGHGRGWLQIDDRFHHRFLASHRGCDSGSFTPRHPSAAPKGRVPSITASTMYAIELLRDNMRVGRNNGVPEGKIVRFALAAYNAGPGNALDGVRQGNVDAHTTGRNYSKDVLARKSVVARVLERQAIPA